MRILWFTNTPSLYRNSIAQNNGGGWIESLEKLMSVQKNMELAVSFFHHDKCFKSRQGNTTYYPISLYDTLIKKIRHRLFYKDYDKIEIEVFLKIVNDFKPDLIHIFGSERSFGLLSSLIDTPLIIHIQGILNPYLNAYFAPNNNKFDLIIPNIIKPLKLEEKLRHLSFFTYDANREMIILKNCKYFMGRTHWDKDVLSLYAPNAKYFYCSEVLRDIFYTSAPWQLKKRNRINIISTITASSYKGFDLILKTAKLLKDHTMLDFEWKVFGMNECKGWEKKLGIKHYDVNVSLEGVIDSSTLVKNIQESDLFVHPSYIDNSPNSICEAQILGAPVISTNVGGISSLIENNKTGYLIPANDPYTLAAKIVEITKDPGETADIGKKARETALLRHDRKRIKRDLWRIYNELNHS